jgi:hypothetical protein
MEQEYQDITRPREVREEVKKLRKKFLRYQEAEVVYSISHRKLIELADRAGALYRMEGTVLINRDIFDAYLENYKRDDRPDPDADYQEDEEEDYLQDLEEDAGIGRSIHCSP